ncbi:MAG: hypothetical protein K6A98_07275 [Prevotella sp.]|nr:hypothetical protein [Prevotella sp.]
MNIIEENKARLKEILKEAVLEALNEIGYRGATVPIVSNMDSDDELDRGNDTYVRPNGKRDSILHKSERASADILPLLTQGVKDNVGDGFVLTFGRKEPDRSVSNLTFTFELVRLLTDKRFVIEGTAKMSRSPIPVGSKKPKRIQIDYKFDEQCFYEAVYCANGTVRDMRPLKLDFAGAHGTNNVNTARELIKFMTMCLYSIDDGETMIINKTPPSPKPVNPIKGR